MMHLHDSYLAPRYRRLPSHETVCGVSPSLVYMYMQPVHMYIDLFPALPTEPSTIGSLERLCYAWNFVGPTAGELPWCNPRWDCPRRKETKGVRDKSACRCSVSADLTAAGLLTGNVLYTIQSYCESLDRVPVSVYLTLTLESEHFDNRYILILRYLPMT